MAFMLILFGFILGVAFVFLAAWFAVNMESRSEDAENERIKSELEGKETKD